MTFHDKATGTTPFLTPRTFKSRASMPYARRISFCPDLALENEEKEAEKSAALNAEDADETPRATKKPGRRGRSRKSTEVTQQREEPTPSKQPRKDLSSTGGTRTTPRARKTREQLSHFRALRPELARLPRESALQPSPRR